MFQSNKDGSKKLGKPEDQLQVSGLWNFDLLVFSACSNAIR